MTATVLDKQTYMPAPGSHDVLARVDAFLEEVEARPQGRRGQKCLLSGPGNAKVVEIPLEVYQVLRQVVAAMSKGLAVTVVPQAMTLTTQQAADLLGISRPTLVRHLETGDIPFERVNSHRKVRLSDVLAYRERRRTEQYAFLDETSVVIEDENDLARSLEQLREVRHNQGAARRKVRTAH